MACVVAVHVGAGSHSSSYKDEYKRVMRKACKEGITILQSAGNALDAVCCATQVLENSPLTNAGYGSSLTRDGTVECDASVMDGERFCHGAVGAVSGIQNPVCLARSILDAQSKPLPGGLIPPSFMAGSGAKRWAQIHSVPTCQQCDLISEKSLKIHKESIRCIENLEDRRSKRKKCDISENKLQGDLLDTVGAVCVDKDGNVASAVSSGGLLLKYSGRIGQAAVYGCGNWAENDFEGSGLNIAVSTSGCGEHLIRTTFAKLCAKAAVSTDPLGQDLCQDIRRNFIESKYLADIEAKMAGSLILRYNPSTTTTDLFWLHTTRSMGVAYMTGSSLKPQAVFSELPIERVGLTVNLNFKSFGNSQDDVQESDVPHSSSRK